MAMAAPISAHANMCQLKTQIIYSYILIAVSFFQLILAPAV